MPRASNPLLRPVAPKRTLNDRWEALSGLGQGFVVLALVAVLGGAIFGLVPSLGEKIPAPVRPQPAEVDAVPTKPAPTAKKPEVKKPPVPTKPEAEVVVPRPVEDGGAELVVPRKKVAE